MNGYKIIEYIVSNKSNCFKSNKKNTTITTIINNNNLFIIFVNRLSQ